MPQNYLGQKSPIYTGINDIPQPPTAQAAGNGSDLIQRINNTLDYLDSDLSAIEQDIAALTPPAEQLWPHGQIIYLSASGNDANDGLSLGTAKASFQACLDLISSRKLTPKYNASPEVIIRISGQVSLTGDYNISLETQGGKGRLPALWIDAAAPGAGFVYDNQASGVFGFGPSNKFLKLGINGLTITLLNATGLYFRDFHTVAVYNSVVNADNTFTDVFVYPMNCQYCEIVGNTFQDSASLGAWCGVDFGQCGDIIVDANFFIDIATAILLEHVGVARLVNNTFSAASAQAIQAVNSTINFLASNTYTNCTLKLNLENSVAMAQQSLASSECSLARSLLLAGGQSFSQGLT